jgi:hypothetical protein
MPWRMSATPQIKRVGNTGEIDLRGVSITSELLGEVIDAAPRGADLRPLVKACRFDGAKFQGPARFAGVIFGGDAVFRGV